MTGEPFEPTLGEVARSVNRVEREMQAGFAAIRREISSLSFVPAPVYAADMVAYRDRVKRLEDDLEEERKERREAEKTAQQRSWQATWSVKLAAIGMPITLVTSVVGAVVVSALK